MVRSQTSALTSAQGLNPTTEMPPEILGTALIVSPADADPGRRRVLAVATPAPDGSRSPQ